MTAPTYIDPGLMDFASPAQRRYCEAINLHGSARAAARALGVVPNAVSGAVERLRRQAALRGYAPDHDMTHTVPQGFGVKGTSTLYKADGSISVQWVKTKRDELEAQEIVRDFVAHLIEDARGLHPPTPPPERVMSELLAVYAFGDPHFGMRALAEEAGEDFDLAEADRLTRAGIDRLAETTPPAERALLIVIGDNTHANDQTNRTPGHGNNLDIDGRHHQAVLASARAWTYAAKRLAERHAHVTVWFMPGNHDPDAAYALALCLSMYFEREPRIEVDLSPGLYRYLRFGKVMIGAHHGHGAKPADLPLLMAVDRPEDWGASTVRYVYMGHIHHDSVREIQGVRVESIRSLAAKDAWHAGQGYRSMRDTRSIVHHRDYGEIERHTCSAAMLAAPPEAA